jgi:hypothetical protein
MKDGICPKCCSTGIHSKPEAIYSYGGVYLPISIFSSARLTPYVCVECGYMEIYVDEPYQRRQLAAKWPKLFGGRR